MPFEFRSIEKYLNENYIQEKEWKKYGGYDKTCVRDAEFVEVKEEIQMFQCQPRALSAMVDLSECLEDADATFSETLLKLIDRKGKTDPEVYKKANVDRKLFSKIRNNANYQPSKSTALAFAIALELDLEETKEFIGHAGYCMTHSSKSDIIVEYFITHGNYDIFELNEALFAFGQPTIGC